MKELTKEEQINVDTLNEFEEEIHNNESLQGYGTHILINLIETLIDTLRAENVTTFYATIVMLADIYKNKLMDNKEKE